MHDGGHLVFTINTTNSNLVENHLKNIHTFLLTNSGKQICLISGRKIHAVKSNLSYGMTQESWTADRVITKGQLYLTDP